MKHLLMDPAFPDVVGEWATHGAAANSARSGCANDNAEELADVQGDPLWTELARLEVAATRLW